MFHRSERALGSISAQKNHGSDGMCPSCRRSVTNARFQVSGTFEDRPNFSSDVMRSMFDFSITQLVLNSVPRTIKACQTLGLPFIPDLNSPEQPIAGCAENYITMDNRGERNSTFTAFLPRNVVRERKDRLHICTSVAAQKIDIVKEDKGLRAQGVWFEREEAGGPRFYAKARKEVVVCSGAIGSPQILLLRYDLCTFIDSKYLNMWRSGIGPREQLEAKGINVLMDHPGVGEYLVGIVRFFADIFLTTILARPHSCGCHLDCPKKRIAASVGRLSSLRYLATNPLLPIHHRPLSRSRYPALHICTFRPIG